MILYTSQLPTVEEIENILTKYKVKPVVIKGSHVNFIWPPQPTGVPISILKYFPPDMYVIFRGRNNLIIVP